MISTDAVIEGIENKNKRFICAVQWRPEPMINHDTNPTKNFQHL